MLGNDRPRPLEHCRAPPPLARMCVGGRYKPSWSVSRSDWTQGTCPAPVVFLDLSHAFSWIVGKLYRLSPFRHERRKQMGKQEKKKVGRIVQLVDSDY